MNNEYLYKFKIICLVSHFNIFWEKNALCRKTVNAH